MCKVIDIQKMTDEDLRSKLIHYARKNPGGVSTEILGEEIRKRACAKRIVTEPDSVRTWLTTDLIKTRNWLQHKTDRTYITAQAIIQHEIDNRSDLYGITIH